VSQTMKFSESEHLEKMDKWIETVFTYRIRT